MTKQEEKELAKMEAQVETHDKNIHEIIDSVKAMMKEIGKRKPKTSDDFYAVGLNLAAAGIRIMQENLFAVRTANEIFMRKSKIVKVKNGNEAKEIIDDFVNGKENDMSGCKDGKKKPCTGKKCGGKKCAK